MRPNQTISVPSENLDGVTNRRNAQVNVCRSTGLFMLSMAVLSCLFSGPNAQALGYGLLTAVALGHAWWLRQSPLRASQIGEPILWSVSVSVSVSLCMCVSALFLPVGPAAATTILPLGLLLFVVSPSLRWAVLSCLAGLALWFVAFHSFGSHFVAVGTGLSSYVIVSVTASWFMVASLVVATRASSETRAGLRSLQVYEASLEAERRENAATRQSIEEDSAETFRQRIELERQLREASELNEELAQLAGDDQAIAAGVHQYLAEPLRNVVSFTQLIQRALAREEEDFEGIKEYFDFVQDGALRMSSMLNDLQRYTNTDEHIEAEVVALDEVLNDIRHNLEGALLRTGGSLHVRTALPSIHGYRTQLIQLFQNLIANALKFGREGVPVVVDISAEQLPSGQVIIDVQDNGIGIPANQIDKVFGLFNRAHGHMQHEGSGVGLALCQRIAMAHGATITLTSEEGAGSCFTITLSPQAIVASKHHAQAQTVAA